ncbi:hypothetical protein BaRGS_00038443 [Batillaria attramentaria]|uniref:Uncharacterized protein n=1 Tax=Batillaria attramentaria TaxID=370345 RepID=A0ABD0J6D3_9CAEN
MNRLALLTLACAATAVAEHPTVDELLHGDVITDYSPYEKTWADFKTKFGRQYASSEEESYRKQLFMDKVKGIEAHNKDYMNGKTTYWKDINQFSDMTGEEFASYVHLEPNEPTPSRVKRQQKGICTKYTVPSGSPPGSWDWREKGYVSRVKNQGNCGACYAFGTTGVIESRLRIQTQGKDKDTLSEQQLVDCFAKSCGGQNREDVFDYIRRAGGIQSDTSYPYTSGSSGVAGTCKFNKNRVVARVTGCRYIARGDETAMKSAVYFNGPVTVGIYVGKGFYDYKGGVLTDPNCKNTSRGRHCLLVVGYGTRGGIPYWIAKNSWGTEKAESGYWLMRRGANTCGMAEVVNFPLVNSDSQGSSGGTGGTGGTGDTESTRSFATASSGKLLLVVCHCIFAVLITSLTVLY